MDEPKFFDGERCITLRVKSKQGQRLHPEDVAFISKFFDEFPDWYRATERRVHNESAPFGSRLKEKQL